MPKEGKRILKYNHGEKSMKAQFIIYAEMEPLLEKKSTCYNNPEQSSTTKIKKSHQQLKYNIQLLVILDLHIVHLMSQKTSIFIIEESIWKTFVKT